MNMPTFPKAFETHDFLDSQRHEIQKETHLFDIKVSFCSQYIYIFVSTFWGWRKEGLHQNEKNNFKIYGATTWLTNNYNIHISQYLMK